MMHAKEWIRRLHHKKSVQWLSQAALVGLLPGLGWYMVFVEPKWIQTCTRTITTTKLKFHARPLRLIHISDLHYGPTNQNASHWQNTIKKVNQIQGDLILITGDLLQWCPKYLASLTHYISQLKSRYGVYVSLGNHDYGVCHPNQPASDPISHEDIIESLQSKGIKVLHNEATRIPTAYGPIDLVGLGDLWTPHFNPESAFKNTDPDLYTIAMSHNPDSFFKIHSWPFDLMLAGHVHGGQISFPWIGPLVVPVEHRHLRRRLHWMEDRWLHTTRGLGHTFRARLLSRPEISVLEVRPVKEGTTL